MRLRGLISAHSNVVSPYEIDPVLEEKYQTFKQNICNDIASCEMMLEMAIGQSSEQDEEEQGEEPLNLAKVPPL